MPSQKVLEAKQQVVADLKERLDGAVAGVLVDYRGLTVAEDTELRNACRAAGVEYMVAKNTLLRLATKDTSLEAWDGILHGPTALAYHSTDVVAAAKVISKFAKDHENLEIKSGFIEGRVVEVSEVEQIAKLPSKEELVAKALGGLNAPISGFVNVLNGNLRGLVCVLNAIAEKQA